MTYYLRCEYWDHNANGLTAYKNIMVIDQKKQSMVKIFCYCN